MRIWKSPHPDVEIPAVSITQRIFDGLGDDPERVVLIDGPSGREMTAGQFVQNVKALAGGLSARGFGRGKVVALMAPNLPEYCVIFHGVAWSGGTITTINPTYTAAEVRHQLDDSGAELLITVAPFLNIAREAAEGTKVAEIVVIGDAGDATPFSDLMGSPLDEQAPVDLEQDVVVLPYSSGTTGLPKGVMLTHRNLVANVAQTLGATDIRPGEMTVAFLPFFHIYGMQVLMNVYLGAGGGLVTMPRFDLEQFLTLCARHRTPRMYIVPPIAIALAKHPMVDDFDLSCVNQVFSGAAPLGGEVADAVGRRLNANATQGYGMTEASPVTHMTPVHANRKGASGVTIPNTETRIVDPETGRDLEPGQTGEVWVRGPQVMKGYLNRPDATAETVDAEGWLHTGDVGYMDEDGYLFLTDRLKELIKYKGFQVAPAELEAALLTHPDVTDAAVIGLPDEEAGELPMAFIVPAEGATVTLEDLQSHLEERLAHYKQIRRMEIVEEIPKSASGKILRRILRERVGA